MSSSARVPKLLLAPEDQGDEIIVSKKKLDKLLQEKDEEITRLREESRKKEKTIEEKNRSIQEREKRIQDLEHQLAVHLNPNVPPSVKNQAPGHSRSHPLTAPEMRKKPGAKPGHPGTTRVNPPPDERVVHTAQACRKCRGHRLKYLGKRTTTETELPPPQEPKVTEHTQHLYRYEDCGEEFAALPPDGRQPTEWGPRVQTEVVLGKMLDRLP